MANTLVIWTDLHPIVVQTKTEYATKFCCTYADHGRGGVKDVFLVMVSRQQTTPAVYYVEPQ